MDIKRISLNVGLAGVFFLFLSGFVGDGWEVKLKVKAGVAQSKLSFGQRIDATDGKDSRFDVPAMLSGDLQVYFDEGGEEYWRDIKSIVPNKAVAWRLSVKATKGETTVLIWGDNFPEGISVNLTDLNADVVVDMRNAQSYSFLSKENVHQFRIVVE